MSGIDPQRFIRQWIELVSLYYTLLHWKYCSRGSIFLLTQTQNPKGAGASMISAGKAKTMFNVHKHAHSRTLILNMRIPQHYRRLWPVPGLEGGSRSSRTHRGQRAAGTASQLVGPYHIISSGCRRTRESAKPFSSSLEKARDVTGRDTAACRAGKDSDRPTD